MEKVLLNGNGEPEYVRTKIGPFGIKTAPFPVQHVAADPERRDLTLQ